MSSSVTLSSFARSLTTETAFDVLAVARRLKAAGKDVIELQIGDSPFPSTAAARAAGKHAIDSGLTRYGPSAGLPGSSPPSPWPHRRRRSAPTRPRTTTKSAPSASACPSTGR